jgi:hypothetical protein
MKRKKILQLHIYNIYATLFFGLLVVLLKYYLRKCFSLIVKTCQKYFKPLQVKFHTCVIVDVEL